MKELFQIQLDRARRAANSGEHRFKPLQRYIQIYRNAFLAAERAHTADRVANQLYDFIRHQAETLWTKGLGRDAAGNPAGFFTPDWSLDQEQAARKGAEYQKPRLGWQVSGATLLEAMNVMKDPR